MRLQMTKNVISAVPFPVNAFFFRYLWDHFRFKRMISTDSGRLKNLVGEEPVGQNPDPAESKPKDQSGEHQ